MGSNAMIIFSFKEATDTDATYVTDDKLSFFQFEDNDIIKIKVHLLPPKSMKTVICLLGC